eukprot:337541_1
MTQVEEKTVDNTLYFGPELLNIMDEKCNLEKCSGLQTLQKLMNTYRNSEDDIIFEKNHISCILENFFHLISKHKTDDEYEYIYNQLGGFCDIKKCKIFDRHYRNRNQLLIQVQYIDLIVKQHVIDKIHCYYSHSYDIGYRLDKQDKQSLENIHKQTDNIVTSDQLLHLSKIISPKHRLYRTKRCVDTSQTTNKFIAYMSFANDNAENSQNNNQKVYSFGFEYAYDEEHWMKEDGHLVSKKYKSLKKEVTDNPYSVMTIQQFMAELNKAKIHFDSYYCKKNVQQPQLYHNRFPISKEHLLAIMIYCNYTELQFMFSQTYRKIASNESIQSVLNRHSNFYWWGKYLKQAVHYCGNKSNDCGIKAFYHGIDKNIMFPQYNIICGVSIYSPVSTSSSFEVAMNFATVNGLVFEFAIEGNSFRRTCFSCSWLSDYGNEAEYLFIQGSSKLFCNNIYHLTTGLEFAVILDALQFICTIMDSSNEVTRIAPNRDKEKIKLLARTILESQLSVKNSNFQRFESLHTYAQKLIDTYFNNQLEQHITQEFFKSKTMDDLMTLFPNVVKVRVSEIELNNVTGIINSILTHLCDDHSSKLEEIWLLCLFESDCMKDYMSLVSQFRNKFKNIHFSVFAVANCKLAEFNIHIWKDEPMLSSLCGKDSIIEITDPKLHAMSMLLKRNVENSPQHFSHMNDFKKVQTIKIDVNKIHHPHQILCYSQFQWININALAILFPNIQKIFLHNIDLSHLALDECLNQLFDSTLSSICITTKKSDNLYISSKHRAKFIGIGYNILVHDQYHITIIKQDQLSGCFNPHFLQFFDLEYLDRLSAVRTNSITFAVISKLVERNWKHSKVLHNLCEEIVHMSIDWADIQNNTMFYDRNVKWIKMHMLDQIFPQVQSLKISNVNLSLSLLENILSYWKTKNTVDCSMKIAISPVNDNFSIVDAISIYHQRFATAKVDIYQEYGNLCMKSAGCSGKEIQSDKRVKMNYYYLWHGISQRPGSYESRDESNIHIINEWFTVVE